MVPSRACACKPQLGFPKRRTPAPSKHVRKFRYDDDDGDGGDDDNDDGLALLMAVGHGCWR